MRIAKYAVVSQILATVAIAVLIVFGIFSSERVFYVIALLLSLLLIINLLVFLFRGYRRVVTRIGTAGERLSELMFLQERRYEQLSSRLDRLSEDLGALRRPIEGEPNNLRSTELSNSSLEVSELEDLNARLQRSERRILGRLEDALLARDLESKQVDALLSELKDKS